MTETEAEIVPHGLVALHERIMRPYATLARQAGVAWEIVDFRVDDYGTATFGRWGGWWLQICPMIFSDRIVLAPISSPLFCDHGWRYPKNGVAAVALIAWDPAKRGEPSGYKKRATPGVRKPGDVAYGWTPHEQH